MYINIYFNTLISHKYKSRDPYQLSVGQFHKMTQNRKKGQGLKVRKLKHEEEKIVRARSLTTRVIANSNWLSLNRFIQRITTNPFTLFVQTLKFFISFFFFFFFHSFPFHLLLVYLSLIEKKKRKKKKKTEQNCFQITSCGIDFNLFPSAVFIFKVIKLRRKKKRQPIQFPCFLCFQVNNPI